MKKLRMNISHFRFILFNLKIFNEIVTTNLFSFHVKRQWRFCLSESAPF